MDLWTIAALVMLVGWAVASFGTTAPGWVHGLLTAGVFILIWRRVVGGTKGVERKGVERKGVERDHVER